MGPCYWTLFGARYIPSIFSHSGPLGFILILFYQLYPALLSAWFQASVVKKIRKQFSGLFKFSDKNFLLRVLVLFGQTIFRVLLNSSRSLFQSAKREQPFLLCSAWMWLPKSFLEQCRYFLHCLPCVPSFLHTDACSYVLLDRFLIRTFNFAKACITRSPNRLRRVRCPFSSLFYFTMSPAHDRWHTRKFKVKILELWVVTLCRWLNSCRCLERS